MNKYLAEQIINNTSLFRRCEPDNLLSLLLEFNKVNYHKDDFIFKENSQSLSLYIILEGDVGLYKDRECIATRTSYEVIGEQGIIDNELRSADAKCLSEVTMIEIPSDRFIDMVKTNSIICYNLLNILSHKLKQATTFRAKILKNERLLEKEIKERHLAESKYRNLFEAVGNPTLLVEMPNRRIIQVNTAAISVYGYRQDEFYSLSFADLTQDKTTIEAIFKERETHIPYTEQKKKDGVSFPAIINARYFKAGQREISVISITDISELKKAEQELKQMMDELKRSNEDLENFAYIVSHDLKNPLSIVVGYLNLMIGYYNNDIGVSREKALDILKKSMDKMDYMDKLMSNLLAYSRINSGAKSFGYFSFKYLVQSALDMLHREISDRGAEISIQNKIEEKIYCDRIQIINVFQNLISNAIRFTYRQAHPRVEIGMEDRGDDWLFYVKDNGIGIRQGDYERIFMIFQRVNSHPEEGSGIGLTFCKKAISIHNGEIWVESKLEKGSTFYFTIPKKQVH